MTDHAYNERQKFIQRNGGQTLTLDQKRKLLIDELRAAGKYLPESSRKWDSRATVLPVPFSGKNGQKTIKGNHDY